MKNCLVVFGLLLLAAGCKKGSDNNDTCLPPTVRFELADKTVTVFAENVNIENGFDLEFDTAGFAQGSGTTQSFTGGSTTFSVPVYGTYEVYLRHKCADGTSSVWTSKQTVIVDGSTNSCGMPYSLSTDDYVTTYRFHWWGPNNGNFYDVEYGPTGFVIGNGTRIRTNNEETQEAILQQGVTYDYYVRTNCGGNSFSSWAGPQSVYADHSANLAVPCTQPTNLYAYKTSDTEISYTSLGHGSVSYEVSISGSSTSLTSNILSVSSPNGGLYRSSGYFGTYYFWIRGKCANNSFTPWSISQVQ